MMFKRKIRKVYPTEGTGVCLVHAKNLAIGDRLTIGEVVINIETYPMVKEISVYLTNNGKLHLSYNCLVKLNIQ